MSFIRLSKIYAKIVLFGYVLEKLPFLAQPGLRGVLRILKSVLMSSSYSNDTIMLLHFVQAHK